MGRRWVGPPSVDGKSQVKDCQSEKREKWPSEIRGQQAERLGGWERIQANAAQQILGSAAADGDRTVYLESEA